MNKKLFFLCVVTLITQIRLSGQYCDTTLHDNGCVFGPERIDIHDFSLGLYSQKATGCSNNGYADYTATDTITLEQNVMYPYKITTEYNYGMHSGMWIDLNDDFDFDDASEFVSGSGMVSFNAQTPYYSSVLLDSNLADTGIHRLRVRAASFSVMDSSSACANFSQGETHDYTVKVLPPPACYPPHNITVQSINATGAAVQWSGNASGFVLEYGVSGFTPGSGTVVNVRGEDTTLNSLNPDTEYTIYVKADCSSNGNGISSYSSPASFRTLCAVVTIYPYNENFDGPEWMPVIDYATIGDAISPCWSRNPGGEFEYKWLVRNFSTAAYQTGPDADRSLLGNYIYTHAQNGFSGDSAKLELPEFDLSSLSKPWFTFYYHMFGSGMGDLHLQLSTDSGQSWTTVYTVSGQQQFSGADDWLQYGIDLTAYSGTSLRLRFVGVRGNDYAGDMAIDEVSLSEGPSCIPVFNTRMISRTTTSVTLYWEGVGSLYEIEYGGAGFSQGTGTTRFFDNDTITLTGLSANTGYDIYVRNACDSANGMYSSWSAVFNFYTDCEAVTAFPWLENFNSGLNCWGVVDENFDNSSWNEELSSANAYRGPNAAASVTSVWGGTANDWLISPKITLSGNQRMEFWTKAYDAFSTPGLFVLISATGTDIEDFQDTLFAGTVAGMTYRRHRFSLAGYSGDVYLAFVNTVVQGIYLDEVLVEDIPSCLEPDSLRIDAIGITTAEISWWPGNANSWNLEYGPPGFQLGNGISAGSTTSEYVLSGLTPDTEYEVYVQSDCGADSSLWSGPVSFRTYCSAVVSPFTETFEETSVSRNCWRNDYYIYGEPDTAWFYATGAEGGLITAAHGGDLNARFTPQYASGGPNTGKLLSPWLDISGLSNPYFTFYYGQEESFASQNYLNIYYRDSIGKEWVLLYSDSTSQPVWKKRGFLLPAASEMYQLAFEGIDNFGNSLVLDDVKISEPPSCPEPDSIEVTNTGTGSAEISWTSLNGIGTDVFCVPENGVVSSYPVISAFDVTSPHIVTGLEPGVVYNIFMQDSCGANDKSDLFGPVSFMTLCDTTAKQTPFVERFEDGINCYTIVDGNSDGDVWEESQMQPNTGFRSATMHTDFNWGDNNDWLITPKIRLGTNDSISFYTSALGGEPDTLLLMMSQTGNDTADFNTVLWSGVVDSDIYQRVSADLSSYALSEVYFAFWVPQSNLDGYYLFIDDLSIGKNISLTCNAPDTISIKTLECDSVELKWHSGSGVSIVEYDTAGIPRGRGWVLDSAASPLRIGGLDPSLEYDFYIRDICSAIDTSLPVGIYGYNAGRDSLPVANFSYSETANPYSFDFDASASGGSIENYEWDFGDGSVASGSVASHSYAIGGSYTVTLTVNNSCGSDDTSIVISNVGNPEFAMNAYLQIYPNPARDHIEIELWTYDAGEAMLIVTDLRGRRTFAEKFTLGGVYRKSLDVARYPAGVYFVEVIGHDHAISRKVVIQK